MKSTLRNKIVYIFTTMNKVIKIIGTIVFIGFIIFFIGNSAIRVSNGSGESIGVFENMIFGESVISFLQPEWSENYLLWER